MSRSDGNAHRHHTEVEPQERVLALFLVPQGCVWMPSHVAMRRWGRTPAPRTRLMSPVDRVWPMAVDRRRRGLRREDSEHSEAHIRLLPEGLVAGSLPHYL